ncbi:MAG TPA: DUF116 domain-containing protein [Candidatus Bathyarchaeia archaeon]|nr:DUF116 domain-containing protein [Candidatus Bathyarchaeia archaeon]
MGRSARELAARLKIEEVTGLNVTDALMLLEDMVDVQIKNVSQLERFQKAGKKALLLPHCSRKYMDNRCKANFDATIPSYICANCSPDCLVNLATQIAKVKKYDVYILPGGSCVEKITKNNKYEGILGVACTEELKIGGEYLKSIGVAGQALPLLKNGCASTKFNLDSLGALM